MSSKGNSTLFMLITVIYTTCLLIANIVAFKLFQLGPWILTASVLVFPITYIVNDLIAEVYGFQKASKIIWIGFGMNLFMVLYFKLAIALPYPPFFGGQEAFSTVLGGTWRLLIASLAAYWVGSHVNSGIMSFMKVKTEGKYLGARVITSTLVGEFFDSAIFVTLAFAFAYPWPVIMTMVLTQTCVKTAYETIAYPLVTKHVITKVKAYEDLDTYDVGISYNPFKK